MMKRIGILFGCVLLLCSSQAKPKKQIDKAGWLLGTWKNETAKGTVYESWHRVNDTEFTGKSYLLEGKDTLIFESLKLVQEQRSLVYIPTVKGHNNDLPVRFTLTKISDTDLVFENAQHDFPQRITYKKIAADTLVAEISGIQNGQQVKETFPMKKI
ncbi:hypothetical protein DBR32_05850 [Taibaiella sp. KBW10]|uniref:DUF6265 family protein n=1 Tax=Taibaiella sp. KBW10 TaxID=2153357 RepID=UPI000F593961|nr:DUF6265 family protein [Taibaiella sp. KBW10]RQO31482.1 hypothetical protein DBR32_05850 [Taibaiella sp. KBW10]